MIDVSVPDIAINPNTPVQPIIDGELHPVADNQAGNSTTPTKTKSALIEEIKAMDCAVRNATRELACAVARLRDDFDLTQTEIAKALGKVQGWVSTILKWHDDGFVEETPFGSFSKAKRGRAKAKIATPKSPPIKYQAPDNSNADASAEARKQQYAEQEAGDGEAAAPAGFSSPDRDGVMDEQGAADHKARRAAGDTKQIKKGSQQHWLSEFRVACTMYLPKMNADTLAKAKELVANWNATITNSI
jgi:hypothetical protein